MAEFLPRFDADFEALLEPIDPDEPTGLWLHHEPLFDEIREARRYDDPTLSQGIYVTELKKADWPLVESLCAETLTTHSKDLQVAAWLTEAWIHLHGFAGAREGLRLIRRLVDTYWAVLHPVDEDGSQDAKRAHIAWIDERLQPALRELPISHPTVGDLPAFSTADRERAERQSVRAHRDAGGDGSDDADLMTHSRFVNSVAMTPTEFYQALFALVRDTADEARNLEDELREHFDADEGFLYRLRGMLASVATFAATQLRERKESLPEDDADPHVLAVSHPSGYEFHGRADAYRMLMEAAEYLGRTEPHSPTPYLVRRAVSWGGMTLEELLQELVKDGGDLMQIYELLGLGREG